ncbi:hypothetical protein RRG08_025959 [Elysia crispata]|uniref:Uncharacterized protein n=1 Tax=Elysia crispata TaxID=231223 RepID=A0AAE0ZGF0_9GAST|nr:hypothetical protein RRG08_025959 [Elysia crispata]
MTVAHPGGDRETLVYRYQYRARYVSEGLHSFTTSCEIWRPERPRLVLPTGKSDCCWKCHSRYAHSTTHRVRCLLHQGSQLELIYPDICITAKTHKKNLSIACTGERDPVRGEKTSYGRLDFPGETISLPEQ